MGLGRIGKRMAHISRNVFKRVVAYDPYIIDGDFPAYVEREATLEGLARQADIVSLHTPLTKETRGMIDAKFFGAMKKGTYFVNTARGAIVNVPDLLAALDAGVVATAGLDVLPEEPIARDSALLTHPRVILSPHAAFYSVEAERELRRKAAQNIVSWHATGRPEYVVVRGSRAAVQVGQPPLKSRQETRGGGNSVRAFSEVARRGDRGSFLTTRQGEPMAGKARRTVLYSSKGKKLYAVRDKSGKFKDIQQYSRAHAMDIKRGSGAEKKAAATKAKKAAKKTAKKSAAKPARKAAAKKSAGAQGREEGRRQEVRRQEARQARGEEGRGEEAGQAGREEGRGKEAGQAGGEEGRAPGSRRSGAAKKS